MGKPRPREGKDLLRVTQLVCSGPLYKLIPQKLLAEPLRAPTRCRVEHYQETLKD